MYVNTGKRQICFDRGIFPRLRMQLCLHLEWVYGSHAENSMHGEPVAMQGHPFLWLHCLSLHYKCVRSQTSWGATGLTYITGSIIPCVNLQPFPTGLQSNDFWLWWWLWHLMHGSQYVLHLLSGVDEREAWQRWKWVHTRLEWYTVRLSCFSFGHA